MASDFVTEIKNLKMDDELIINMYDENINNKIKAYRISTNETKIVKFDELNELQKESIFDGYKLTDQELKEGKFLKFYNDDSATFFDDMQLYKEKDKNRNIILNRISENFDNGNYKNSKLYYGGDIYGNELIIVNETETKCIFLITTYL